MFCSWIIQYNQITKCQRIFETLSKRWSWKAEGKQTWKLLRSGILCPACQTEKTLSKHPPSLHLNSHHHHNCPHHQHLKLISCPEQLDRWLIDWVTALLTYKEWLKRLVTFETFDQIDEETWPKSKLSKMVKVVKILKKYQNFKKIKNFKKFQKFKKNSTISKLSKFQKI